MAGAKHKEVRLFPTQPCLSALAILNDKVYDDKEVLRFGYIAADTDTNVTLTQALF
jgi:hypothetical protein